MLIVMGLFRLGFVANFLSHPVISGFITASGLLIAASQLKYILGVPAGGNTLTEIVAGLVEQHRPDELPRRWPSGWPCSAFLYFVRLRLKRAAGRGGHRGRAPRTFVTKAGPVLAVAGTILATSLLGLGERGVALVGAIPSGPAGPGVPALDLELIRALAVPALLISLIGFVESVSVAQTLAAKRRQRIVPDQELIGLGAANIAAAISSGYPVTGGFARSVVNFDAGARDARRRRLHCHRHRRSRRCS